MADGTPIIIKKKKVMAAGHHGGSWKVAYADFVTAMMAFFMVMWIMGMEPETKSMIQGYFNDPFGMLKSPPKSQTVFPMPGSPKPKEVTGQGSAGQKQLDHQREEEQLAKLEREIKSELEENGKENPDLKALLEHVEVSITEEGLRLEFVEAAGSVFFLSGDYRIRPLAEELIASVTPMLAKSKRSIKVEGHTDGQPYSSPSYTNWDLSCDRALEMRRVLSRHGVLMSQYAEVRGFADTKLKVPDDPYSFMNRRVTVLLPFRTATDSIHDLPKLSITEEIEGAFRQPVELKPELAPPPISSHN